MKKKCIYDKLPDNIKSWKFPVFDNYEIKVVSSNDVSKAGKRFKHTKNVPMEKSDGEAFTVHIRGEQISYIFIPHRTSLGVVVHEAYHAIRKMLLIHGVEVDDNEVVAYHLGYLVQQVSDWRWSWKCGC